MRHSQAARVPDEHTRSFVEGDRVMALSRPGFPAGTVVKLLTHDHVLVRWDGNVLEAASRSELDWSDSD
jgi:hypothetical protein